MKGTLLYLNVDVEVDVEVLLAAPVLAVGVGGVSAQLRHGPAPVPVDDLQLGPRGAVVVRVKHLQSPSSQPHTSHTTVVNGALRNFTMP